eukprot:scaffold176362_cov21-Prasinocladus_malaysianus.AAC.1
MACTRLLPCLGTLPLPKLRNLNTHQELQRRHSDAQEMGKTESEEAKAAIATAARLSARINELTLQ